MKRVFRWCTLAGITAALLALTLPAFGATGWTVLTPKGLVAGTENYLNGSFARTNTDAWAVGESVNDSSGAEVPLALHWNGKAWSSVRTPAPSGSTPNWMLESVAAGSASNAWAVGEQSAGTKIHDSLYEHWNGTKWSVVTGPNEGVLNAVLDFSKTNAWAFADFSVLHWNGAKWSVVSGAFPALRVSADGPHDIWGVYRNDMVTHYNGTSWSVYTLSKGTPGFQSVEALSPTDVWVSGANTTGTVVPALEHFNGKSWQTMKMPSSFAGHGLNVITARSASDLWVFSNTGSPNSPLLLANWDGSSWKISSDPLPSDTEVLLGAAATSPSHVWLFGTFLSASGYQPLILSHS
jgi:hypothetical protein